MAQAARLYEQVEKTTESIFNEWFDIIALTNCEVFVEDNDGSSFVVKQNGAIVGQVGFAVAEEKSKDYDKVRVTHGVGTRLYYEKLGYDLEEYYMVKNFS